MDYWDYWKFLDELDAEEAARLKEKMDTNDFIDEENTVNVGGIQENSSFSPKYPMNEPLGLSFYLNKEDTINQTDCSADDVDHPSHYTGGGQEAIDTIEDAVKDAPDAVVGGLQWNALKYLLRLWLKGNPKKDALKARWYLNRLIDKL